MLVHILIPASDYKAVAQDNSEWLKEEFTKFLKKRFGGVELNPVRKSSISAIEIYVMGKPRGLLSQAEAIEDILSLLKTKFGSVADGARVLLNYSAYDPDFSPVNDEETEEKAAESSKSESASEPTEFDYDKLSKQYEAITPRFTFDQLVLPEATKDKIIESIGIFDAERIVFDVWGLRSIIPVASSVLSFFGPPGTGKTMAAEAVASKLGKKILSVTYADIESKYHGEGPKMVKAVFKAAEDQGAVLFIDESDSLLSKRLTSVTDGSAQAINSMRSQLLISLEQYKGIVIFATNLVVNYDKAFLSRMINIEFTLPTAAERDKIWWNHLKSDKIHIPLSSDVDVKHYADSYEFCGREIRNAVKFACVSAVLDNRSEVCHNDFIKACERIKGEQGVSEGGASSGAPDKKNP